MNKYIVSVLFFSLGFMSFSGWAMQGEGQGNDSDVEMDIRTSGIVPYHPGGSEINTIPHSAVAYSEEKLEDLLEENRRLRETIDSYEQRQEEVENKLANCKDF